MIPIKDENPTQRFAWVTLVLIVVNVGVYFLVQQAQPEFTDIEVEGETVEIQGDLAFNLEYAAVPCELTQQEPLTLEEAEDTFSNGEQEACTDDEGTELYPDKNIWLSVVFSMFLHGGLLHLGGNMIFLWIFGNNIEDRLGPILYLAFYVAGGLVAALAHVLVAPDSTIPVVGASGAIAAVMGAYLVWFPDAPVRTLIFFFFILFVDIRARWLLIGWFVMQFFTSPDSGVAWVAHVGGFAFGVAVALLVRFSGGARDLVFRESYQPTGPWDSTGGIGRGPYEERRFGGRDWR